MKFGVCLNTYQTEGDEPINFAWWKLSIALHINDYNQNSQGVGVLTLLFNCSYMMIISCTIQDHFQGDSIRHSHILHPFKQRLRVQKHTFKKRAC